MPKPKAQSIDPHAEHLSVKAWCARNSLSQSFAYKLWAEDRGPPFIHLGRKRLIPVKAAARWLAQLTKR